MKYLWIVGRRVDDSGREWEFCGVFDDEAAAVAHCTTDECWVGRAELNRPVPIEITSDWPLCWYPQLEPRPPEP
jgi:hypothetical protein